MRKRMLGLSVCAVAALVTAAFMQAGSAAETTSSRATTTYGPAKSLGNGSVRSYLTSEGGKPIAIGVVFPRSTLSGLPIEANDGLRCFDVNGDGSVDNEMECAGGHERPLEFPSISEDIPFSWSLVNWNPHGHGAPGVYDKPHFDFHFYIQPKVERDNIDLGPCGIIVDCDDYQTGIVPLPAGYQPPDYSEINAVEGKMGDHMVDKTSPEWNGKPFTKTFIYGKYDGRLSFLEPMVSKASLDALAATGKGGGCVPIKRPAHWQQAGWYPRYYCVRFRPGRQDYTVSLESFAHS